MANSHKNTSMGGREGHGDSGPDFRKIADNKAHVPPPGASNSYEKVLKKMDSHDRKSMGNKHYTREKMMNK